MWFTVWFCIDLNTSYLDVDSDQTKKSLKEIKKWIKFILAWDYITVDLNICMYCTNRILKYIHQLIMSNDYK